MIDMIRKDKITAMIQKAKKQADCIIFVAHWGTEAKPCQTNMKNSGQPTLWSKA